MSPLLNYCKEFATALTKCSKDGYAYMTKFLGSLLNSLREWYYRALTWWFSLSDQTKNYMGLGLFALMLYWFLFKPSNSYHHHNDYPDDYNLHQTSSSGYNYRGGYGTGLGGGGYHDTSTYGGGYGGNYYGGGGGGMSWTMWGLIMLGKHFCSPLYMCKVCPLSYVPMHRWMEAASNVPRCAW